MEILRTEATDIMIVSTHRPFLSLSTSSGPAKDSMVSNFSQNVLRAMFSKIARSALDVCVTSPFAPRLSDENTKVNGVRPTRCLISVRRTIQISVVLRKSGSRDA